jgi:WD40 repeat protein
MGGRGGTQNTVDSGAGAIDEIPRPSCPQITVVAGQFNACGRANSIAYSPDGTLVAMGTESARPNVHLWRLSDGMLVRDIDGIGATTYKVAFSPDGRTLVTGGGPESGEVLAVTPDIVKLWDASSGALLRTLPATCGFYVSAVAFSPDGSLLATSGATGPIEIWSVADGTLVQSIPYPSTVHNVHFSPDGAQLIAGGFDGRATIWNVAAGTLAMTLNGTASEMADAAFSPDGSQIVTTGADNALKLWDATTGTLLQTLTGHALYVSHVVWVSQDRIISNDWGGTIKSWTRGASGFAASGGWSTGGQSLGIDLSPRGGIFVAGGYDPAARVEGFVFLPL